MIDPERLMGWQFAECAQSYGKRDTILYALGLGCGADPCDERELRYVYEEGLQALPTMATVLASPGNWLRDAAAGVDYLKVVHGEQWLELHRPLPPEGAVSGRSRVTAVLDKGTGKGTLIYVERKLFAGAEALATVTMSVFARGDGGFGGTAGPPPRTLEPVPDDTPELACDIATLPGQALLYRLSGDYNALHADPGVARAAGFRAPILHGLCTYGIAGRAVVKSCCNGDASRLAALEARFSAPVYPGETLRTELWRDGDTVRFRTKVLERGVAVLTHGRARLRA